jgi:tetraacyldisaccharide 4'-kinase
MIYFQGVNLLLAVFSPVSRAICALKTRLSRKGWIKSRRAPLPVISVGNIAFGGSGKTPLVMELLDWALGRGLKPALVTRGYKGRWEKDGGILSDGLHLSGGWREAGDEPFMVARRFPEAGVFVGRHRYLSCTKARERGFDLAILDDGFQHLKLARDLDIVLMGGGSKPLREGRRALRRAGILLLDATSGAAGTTRFRAKFPGLRIFEYRLRPTCVFDLGTERSSPPESVSGARAVAFCGIARPERFFTLLDALGVRLVEKLAFPDHYDYPPWGLERIGDACLRHWPSALLTTEKDAVKIEDSARKFFPVPILVLRIGLDLPGAFFDLLDPLAGRAGNRDA